MQPVRAAGGVLWRHASAAAPRSDDSGDGQQRRSIEVAVVHRPRYDDWTLPKGKLDPDETFAEAAVREVEEETGHRADLGADLGEIRYPHAGREKVVRYWAMRDRGGDFGAGAEVDRLRWMPPDQAAGLLTYDRDREVLTRFGAALADNSQFDGSLQG